VLTPPSVNPLYYVTFTTATLCASFILYGGFNTSDTVNTISLVTGFLVTFTGVYLLNLSRTDPNGRKLAGRAGDVAGPDPLSTFQTRVSMQSRRSTDPYHRGSLSREHGDCDGLMRAYDEESEAGFGLTDLAEDSDDDVRSDYRHHRRSGSHAAAAAAANGNGHHDKARPVEIEMQPPKAAAARSPQPQEQQPPR
jgi:hypothetical protein